MIFIVLLKELIKEAEAKYGYYQALPENVLPKHRMSGFMRVRKIKTGTKKGYTFRYQIRKDKNTIHFTRINLLELKREVDNRGLPWEVANELLAKKLVSDEGLDWEDFKDERE